jgi:hypothetical protein
MRLFTILAVVAEVFAMPSIHASTCCERAEGSMVCKAGSHMSGISLDSTRIKRTKTKNRTKTTLGGEERVVDSVYVYYTLC